MTMAVMAAEVSRALAAFIADMGLGRDAARTLAGQYAAAGSITDLPEWLTERPDDDRAVTAKYNPAQMRDPGGDDGGQWVRGPSMPELDMEGFDLISRAEGSFGTLDLGVDDVGDVRFAFHEGRQARALDLGSGEVGDLRDILERLTRSRDDLEPDAESDGIYDDDRFGFDNSHTVQLYGNGLISITFGADEPDPDTLNLDPPDGEDDDVQTVLDAIGEVERELDAREPVRAAAGIDTHPGGEQLKRYWVFGEGAALWSTWTELEHHLLKYLNEGMAKRTAAAWYHLRYGIWPGSDANRVKHGKPPRGKVVGPG